MDRRIKKIRRWLAHLYITINKTATPKKVGFPNSDIHGTGSETWTIQTDRWERDFKSLELRGISKDFGRISWTARMINGLKMSWSVDTHQRLLTCIKRRMVVIV